MDRQDICFGCVVYVSTATANRIRLVSGIGRVYARPRIPVRIRRPVLKIRRGLVAKDMAVSMPVSAYARSRARSKNKRPYRMKRNGVCHSPFRATRTKATRQRYISTGEDAAVRLQGNIVAYSGLELGVPLPEWRSNTHPNPFSGVDRVVSHRGVYQGAN